MPFTRKTAEAMGRQGGRSTFARHGRDHMAEIGRLGFKVTCDLHYGGDRRTMLNELIRRGLRAIDPCPWNGVWQDFTPFPAPSEEGPL